MNNILWKLDRNEANKVRDYIIKCGGEQIKIKSNYELWRIKYVNITFIYYQTGKLLATGNNIENNIKFIDDFIQNELKNSFKKLEYEYFLGFDETGKGEVVGHIVLCGVMIHKKAISLVEQTFSTSDTKKTRTLAYWSNIFEKVKDIDDNLNYHLFFISPFEIDGFNLNQLLDYAYIKLIKIFLKNLNKKAKIRLTIDNYGAGEVLLKYLEKIKKKSNILLKIESKADDKYPEAHLASLISKFYQQSLLSDIKKTLFNQNIGSGNLNDIDTINWIKTLVNSGIKVPWFIRQSYIKSILELRPEKVKHSEQLKFKKVKFKDYFKNLLVESSLAKKSFRNSIKTCKNKEEFYLICEGCQKKLVTIQMKFLKYAAEPSIYCDNCGESLNTRKYFLAIKYFYDFLVLDNNLNMDIIRKFFLFLDNSFLPSFLDGHIIINMTAVDEITLNKLNNTRRFYVFPSTKVMPKEEKGLKVSSLLKIYSNIAVISTKNIYPEVLNIIVL